MIDLLTASEWQMTFGERAALEGLLAELEPKVAIEIGTASGGSLRRLAKYSDEVHSFDLVQPPPTMRALDNVTFHTGEVMRCCLSTSSRSLGRRAIDFVLVDGDHTADGVRRDLDDLLASDAIARCIIVIHDTANEVVRAGLEMVDYDAYPKVKHVDLDFVAGHLSEADRFTINSGAASDWWSSMTARGPTFGGPQEGELYSSFELLESARGRLREQERSGQTPQPYAGLPPARRPSTSLRCARTSSALKQRWPQSSAHRAGA